MMINVTVPFELITYRPFLKLYMRCFIGTLNNFRKQFLGLKQNTNIQYVQVQNRLYKRNSKLSLSVFEMVYSLDRFVLLKPITNRKGNTVHEFLKLLWTVKLVAVLLSSFIKNPILSSGFFLLLCIQHLQKHQTNHVAILPKNE